mmetsp:Transcript_21539/g.40218  ORF Transcript_21539/g.40218 Transcript_21539/m.40218 type:complete len:793 (-) Transcript_21539:824-3202(-)
MLGQQAKPAPLVQDMPDWLDAIVVVAFHVEHGQMIEDIYSLNSALTEAAKRKICSLSLPDSNSGQNGDVHFIFRFRESASPLDSMNPMDIRFRYCSAFFRQIKDPSLKRGYFQKSVVLVSSNPNTSFLEECSFVVGPLFFEYGKNVVEAMLQNIKSWPAPVPGESFRLPLAGCSIRVRVPVLSEHRENWISSDLMELSEEASKSGKPATKSPPRPERCFVYESSGDGYHLQQKDLNDGFDEDFDSLYNESLCEGESDEETSNGEKLTDAILGQDLDFPGLFQEVPLFTTFGGLSVALWHIWEMAITGEPIIVLAPTPDRCSQAVLAIASLVAPMQYGGDYRPYFTIYDSDFMEMSQKHNADQGRNLPPCVIGVTNPYFLKTFEYWPNVILMGGTGPSTTALARSLTPPPKEHREETPLESNVALMVGKNDQGDIENAGDEVKRQHVVERSISAPINALHKEIVSSSRRIMYTSTGSSSLRNLTNMNSLSVEGESVKNARYCPTVARRGESLRALLTDRKYERSVILSRGEPLVPPDVNILRQLLNEHDAAKVSSVLNNGDDAEPPALALNNALLRQHFQNLTQAFLEPLEAYMRLESVGSRAARENGISVSAYEEPRLALEVFNEEHFFMHLESEVPRQLQQIDWRQLYSKFFKGPNFAPWFREQREKLVLKLQYIYRHLRLHTDSEVLLSGLGANHGERARALNEIKGHHEIDAISQPGHKQQDSESSPATPAVGDALDQVKSTSDRAAKLFLRIKRALDNELAKDLSQQDEALTSKIREHLAVVESLLNP